MGQARDRLQQKPWSGLVDLVRLGEPRAHAGSARETTTNVGSRQRSSSIILGTDSVKPAPGARHVLRQQHQAMHGLAEGRLGLWCCQLIEQAGLAIGCGIEAEVPQRAGALLVLPAGDAHQPHPIAQVVLQGPADAAAQIGPSGLACPAAGSGAEQGLTGHLDQIFPLHQRE
jgi:hypothetical protein